MSPKRIDLEYIDTELPAYEIDILIEDENWPCLDVLEPLAARVVKASILNIQVRPFAELSIAFFNDAKVQVLNRTYRAKDKPTNVLSFAIDNAGTTDNAGGFSPLLGDIVLAYETVFREAHEKQIKFEDHIAHLLVHGFLHLQGYDHEEASDADAMEALEVLILADLGIADPYAKDELL
ncbi:MAG: rRNA maturation RNase YbeY [Robiginitomaculum sp.]|nr:MAG: rRNA maturation RNase YbeY [Robiginitomaculum sp.]